MRTLGLAGSQAHASDLAPLLLDAVNPSAPLLCSVVVKSKDFRA